MARQTRSIKGELVDFDLFEVKRKIGEKPISADVKNREDFVYSKRKRGSKRAVEKMMENQEPTTQVQKVSPKVEENPLVKPNVKDELKKRKIIKKR